MQSLIKRNNFSPEDRKILNKIDRHIKELEDKVEQGGGSGNTSGGTSSGVATLLYEVTYDQLVDLRNNGELIPGSKYRMIDYETIIDKENCQSAGNVFDLILTALDNKTLDEECKAIQSERDVNGYFAKNNLANWKIQYCLNNDKSRFSWAKQSGPSIGVNLSAELGDLSIYYYNKITIDNKEYHAWGPIIHEMFTEMTMFLLTDTKTPSVGDVTLLYAPDYEMVNDGPTIISVDLSTEGGKGVIYKMIDEFNNEAHYDFKNILFLQNINSNYRPYNEYVYTFYYDGGNSDSSLNLNCNNNHIGKNSWNCLFSEIKCYNNYIGNNCKNIYIDISNDNIIEDNCENCVIGKYGSHAEHNIIKNNSTRIEIYNHAKYCCVGSYCDYVEIDEYAENVVIGNFCSIIHFQPASQGDQVSSYCKNIKLDNYCTHIQILTGAVSQTKYVQNVTIKASASSTTSDVKEIIIPALPKSENYERVIAKNSSGEIIIYCPQDYVNNTTVE